MPGRATSDLLLLGSLPADSTEEALRAGGELFCDLVFALPDGETGPRAAWVGYERELLVRPHPGRRDDRGDGIADRLPRHADETPVFAVREGADGSCTWTRGRGSTTRSRPTRLPRAARRRRRSRAGLRFQVGLPFPSSGSTASRRTSRTTTDRRPRLRGPLRARDPAADEAIPPADLAIQWDVCCEVLDLEGVIAWMDDGAWDRFAGPVARLTRLIPEDVLVGYHLCYGTFPEWPMYEARDMGLLVRMANYAVAHSGRTVDWLHLAGPRYLRSEDERFFAPLRDLDVGDTRVYLGIVLPIDGLPGLRRRHATASKYLDDFGVAMYCGFGRQPGQDGMETMHEHRAVVTALRD